MNTAPPENADFVALTRSREFAEFSSLLKKLTGLVMALNSPTDGTIVHMFRNAEQNPVCRLIRKTRAGCDRCGASDRTYHAQAVKTGTTCLYTCHAGFLDIAVPVFVDGRHVTTISSGQIAPGPHSDAGFRRLRKRLDWLDVPDHRLRAAYNAAPYLPRRQITYIMQLLELFARQLCESSRRIRWLEAQMERPEIKRARGYVERQFADPALCLREVSRHAGLSPAHFSKVFHRVTGVNFARYVQVRRVAEAKQLLKGTERTVTDICFACGFSSLTHFNRVFRLLERCSPSRYRRGS